MLHLDDATAEVFAVTGAHSIAHLLPKSKGRCGIYVLRFANGDRYVGQAVDVVTRFATHRLNYSDITEVAFWRVPRGDLDTVERAEIRRREEQGVRLRNVVHTSGRLGASDFDILLPPQEQDAWLTSPPSDLIDQDTRPQHPALRRDSHVGFNRLIADPRFARAEFALRRYIAWTIPAPQRTELSYWTASARPGTLGGKRLLTVTVHNLETLFLYAPRNEPDVADFRLNVDRKTLLDRWGTLEQLMDRLWGLHADEPKYRARPGLVGLWVDNPRDFVRLLSLDGVVAAARRLNLDLMRKGAALNWKSHSLDLADRLLALATAQQPDLRAAGPEHLFETGCVLDDQGRFDEAYPFYQRAADAGHAAAMFRLGVLMDEQGRHDEAEGWWRRAAEAGHSDSAVSLGQLLAERGDLAGAETAFAQAVHLDGSDTALFGLGMLNEARGDLETAAAYYRRAAECDNTDAMVNLGLLLQGRGDLKAAEDMFRRAVDAGDEEARNLL